MEGEIPPFNLMNRQEAITAGKPIYHGKPCKNCGDTLKYVENCRCMKCNRDACRERARRKRIEKDIIR